MYSNFYNDNNPKYFTLINHFTCNHNLYRVKEHNNKTKWFLQMIIIKLMKTLCIILLFAHNYQTFVYTGCPAKYNQISCPIRRYYTWRNESSS